MGSGSEGMSSNKTGNFKTTFAELAKFVEILQSVVCECRLRITDTKASVICVDTANVVLVDVKLAGITSTVPKDREVSLGLDIPALSSAFRALQKLPAFDPESETTLSWSPGREHPDIFLEVRGIGFKARFNSFDVNTIRKDPNPPVLTLTTKATLDGEVFRYAITISRSFSDRVRIECSQKGCVIASNSDTKECRISVAGKVSGEYEVSLYSIDYLKDLSKTMVGYPVIVNYRTDHPISFEFFPSINLSAKYLLAPRLKTTKRESG